MFVAWRDLRFAKGRFALMGAVIVLITLLVGLLSGLTAGLARENVSAITGLPADRLAFAAPPAGQSASFTNSTVSEKQWREWAGRPGVSAAAPLGIRTLNAASGDRTAAVSAFGADPDAGLAPGAVGPGKAVLSESAAEELGVSTGGALRLGPLELSVAGVAGDASYSHTPVVWTSLDDWQKLGHGGTTPEEQATVIALRGDGTADWTAGDRALGTEARTLDKALTAIGSYQAENGSLQLMRGFLFVISALVIGAFFTVWTIQRSGDVAVLKALGASTPYLLRDALGQAVLMLTAGTLAGTALAVGTGFLISGGDVPFVLEPLTVLGPAAVIVVLGVLGSALSIRRITAVDPLTALGSAR
ncbi:MULTISPECIES: FtsX-like permease family protein [unclassified Streptomyces]|uniref:FtsX-like permease family protein n=1 Tax=unclassified Streptomyces TaxID=2593676 RepID=UPI00166043E7|nr:MULTISPECIES: FtsX-like permease family protein [unclassified Streptomyces]MBD0711892.1 ABC transporter substrate-binding protein [Streptomyces sp. CBMA291]MBD0713347.1 ABC transporter substrate-binding protein [Streptomyces sp. CBMA370]